jgi:hypothetical protein
MPERIQDQIKTWEDICAALQRDPNALPDVSMLPEKHQKFVLASIKLTYAAEALNEGWEPNWNNPKEDKYYNYFWLMQTKNVPPASGSRTRTRVGRARARMSVPASFLKRARWRSMPACSLKNGTRICC